MKDQPSKRAIHRAKVLGAAEATVAATAQNLKQKETDFLFALDCYRQAIQAHAHAVTTLDYVKIDQQSESQGGVQ